MSSLIDIALPDVGSDDGVEVVEILVSIGDKVELEQALLGVESDKASMEIPAALAGTVEEILVNVGDSLTEGSIVMRLQAAQGAAGEPSPLASDKMSAEEPAEFTESTEVNVYAPDMGDVESAEVIELNVAVGDAVEQEQALLSLESDKASMEIPSTVAGVVTAIHVKVGDQLSAGPLLPIKVLRR